MMPLEKKLKIMKIKTAPPTNEIASRRSSVVKTARLASSSTRVQIEIKNIKLGRLWGIDTIALNNCAGVIAVA